MLDSILIEITRRPMSYRTVIALTEPNETAFRTSGWFPHVPGWSCLLRSTTTHLV